MTHEVDGIYSNEYGYWHSNELFAKQGEIRLIDGKLHARGWKNLWSCSWYPVTPDYASIHGVVEARCVFKKRKK